MNVHPMWKPYPQLEKELGKTLDMIEDSIRLSNKPVETAIHEMIHAGGKLLRPAYQLMFAQFGTEDDSKKRIALAAAIETLHTATLIHDDIVDDAKFRRSNQTIQYRYGKDVAVYAGDYLFVTCFKLLANYASSLKSIQLNSVSMEKILNGELGQMDTRYDTTVTVDRYLDNISGKTAELFGLSCAVGAFESGCSKNFAKTAGEIGNLIGISFQIIDDVLDYAPTMEKIGKPIMGDIRQGVYTLPLICAMEQHRTEFLPYLNKQAEISEAECEYVYSLVNKYNGIQMAENYAQDFTKKALEKIVQLPDNPKHTKETLRKVTSTILYREA